jgi:hypothetical protein
MAVQYLPRSLSIGLVALIVPSAFLASGRAQDTARQDDKQLAQQWFDERKADFQEYDFQREAARPAKLTMEPRSLLNWSNPERGSGYGALFLWTDEGRPQMIACAFEWGGSLKHEFHSLSTDPISGQRGGNPVHRFAAGLEFKSLPGAPQPAGQRALRLTQMRRLAERFRVTMGNKEWSETRLLPQPVFRSPMSLEDDVAVFAFVQGTDPECTLLLEATPEKQWRYALARQTKWGLKVELDGKPIWDVAPLGRPQPQSPFVVLPQIRSVP